MTNAEIIWKYLMIKYNNPYGVAALMGNLYVESKLDPGYVESQKLKKLGMTSKEYVKAIDDGTYSRNGFAHDGVGFGLAQWTYWSRKEKLYDMFKEKSNTIASLDLQLEYLCWELETYKTVIEAIQNLTDVRACSDIIVKRYEKPKNQTEEFLVNRAKYGQQFFDQLLTDTKQIIKDKQKYVVATSNVNLRRGNGTSYDRVGTLLEGRSLSYVAESDNGWYAAVYKSVSGTSVVWLSKEYSKLEER